jgi:hypothetical protein
MQDNKKGFELIMWELDKEVKKRKEKLKKQKNQTQ